MNTYSRDRKVFCALLLFTIASAGAMPARIAAQSAGSIEFAARVTPTDGRPEPVRQLTFYLLKRSVADIRQEVEQQDPPPDFDKFVDGLKMTPKLRDWMKKNKTVQLSGSEFIKRLTPMDIMDVPEFFNAYMARNVGFAGVGFPTPKFKEKDLTANPEKYAQQKKEYLDAISKFIGAYPDSVQGMEADLSDINPYAKWSEIVSGQKSRLDKRALELAETRYLAAQTDTNLEGRGSFSSVAPGDYWVSTLGTQAVAGDVRIRWDLHVTVRPGEVARVQMTNLNAMQPDSAKSNSNL